MLFDFTSRFRVQVSSDVQAETLTTVCDPFVEMKFLFLLNLSGFESGVSDSFVFTLIKFNFTRERT